MGKKTKAKQSEQPSASANGKAKGLPPTPPPDDDEATKQLGNNEPANDKVKGRKKSGSKRAKKESGGFFSAFSLKRVFIVYILYVILFCPENAEKQADSPFVSQSVCNNRLSHYILKHDLFKQYVEPSILFVKVNYNEHARPHVDRALVQFDKHVKPHVTKASEMVKSYAEPHVETVKGYAQVYYGQGKDYYDTNFREHVDKYYSQASVVVTPYAIKARDHASNAYDKAQEYHEKQFLPWYKGTFLPWTYRTWVRAVVFFQVKVVPAAEKAWEKTKEAYDAYVVPQYYKHIHPHYEKYVLLHYRKHVEPHYRRYVHPYVVEFTSWVQMQIVGKEELARRAREADEKERAERKRKEAEAARVATDAFRKNADAATYEYRETVLKSINAFDVAIRVPVQTALEEINSEIDKLKTFTEDEVDKFKVLVGDVTADSKKTVAEKNATLAQSTKESLERITEAAETARLAIGKTSSTVMDALDSSKKSVEAEVNAALRAVQKTLTESTGKYPKADKTAVRNFLRQIDEVRDNTGRIGKIYGGDKANISQAITLQTGNVDYIVGEVEQKIQKAVDEATASLKEQEPDTRSDEQVVDETIVVGGDKRSKVAPTSATSEAVFDLLMRRYEEQRDPALKKLMKGYERRKEGAPAEEEFEFEIDGGGGDDYEDEEDYGEHCDDPGEC